MAEPFLLCPDHWVKTTLEPDVNHEYIVRVGSGSTPSTTKEEYWDGGIPWLTPKEITSFDEALFVTKTERTVSLAGLSSCSAKILPAGTVMLSKRAPVGAVAVNVIPMATNQGFLNFECGPSLRPLYLAHWLRVNRPYLDIIANGSTYPELYRGDLFEIELSIPPLSIQDKILSAISSIQLLSLLGLPLEQSSTDLKSIIQIQEQNRRLMGIKNRILPLLLSGQIDVSKINALKELEARVRDVDQIM